MDFDVRQDVLDSDVSVNMYHERFLRPSLLQQTPLLYRSASPDCIPLTKVSILPAEAHPVSQMLSRIRSTSCTASSRICRAGYFGAHPILPARSALRQHLQRFISNPAMQLRLDTIDSRSAHLDRHDALGASEGLGSFFQRLVGDLMYRVVFDDSTLG